MSGIDPDPKEQGTEERDVGPAREYLITGEVPEAGVESAPDAE